MARRRPSRCTSVARRLAFLRSIAEMAAVEYEMYSQAERSHCNCTTVLNGKSNSSSSLIHQAQCQTWQHISYSTHARTFFSTARKGYFSAARAT